MMSNIAIFSIIFQEIWKLSEDYQKVLPKDDPSEKCCACHEADYDVEFIGIWSKDTHPKDYPSCSVFYFGGALFMLIVGVLVEYLTHFTDMLGASHSNRYSLYRYGDVATDGLKEIAEWGNTYKGESEMKANVGGVWARKVFRLNFP